jgi:hypothetical protein
LAYEGPSKAAEFHIASLSHRFRQAGIHSQLKWALWVMELMGEVEHLGGGYWFPTQTRTVDAGEQSIVLSSSPTRQLRRTADNIAIAGYARVGPRGGALSRLPLQNIADWIRCPLDSVKWSESEIRQASRHFGPSGSLGRIEYFGVASTGAGAAKSCLPSWFPRLAKGVAVHPDGIVLCRERIGRESHRYFLGRVRRDSISDETPAPRDVTRVQYGLARISGAPLSALLEHRHDQYRLYIPGGLPREERRLLLALATRGYGANRRTYTCASLDFTQLIHQSLVKLGAEIQGNGK